MKLIMHIGLPKSATTYIQAVANASVFGLESAGIYYPPDPDKRIANHYFLVKCVNSGDYGSIHNYLAETIDAAQSKGCNTILLSQEELIFLPAQMGCVQLLSQACKNHNLDASIILTGRPWADFFVSFARQEQAMVGGSRWRDWAGLGGVPSLSAFMAHNIRHWINFFGSPMVTSYIDVGDVDIAARFFRMIGYYGELADIARENVRGGRWMLAESLSGSLASLYSAIEQRELYDECVESFRADIYERCRGQLESDLSGEWSQIENLMRRYVVNLSERVLDSISQADRDLIDRYFV